MDASLVGYENHDGIVRLTLNRPEKLNALSDGMVQELAAALDRFDRDDDADVALLHGAGRAFCSGADLVAAQQRQDAGQYMFTLTLRPRDLFYRSSNWKPVVAAVHGYALGAGLGLALRADALFVTPPVKFQITEVARGLSPGGLWALLHFRGAGALADDIVFSGRFFTGEEAHQRGIVTGMAEDDALLDTAEAYARQIQRLPANSIRTAVRVRRRYMENAEREAAFIGEMKTQHPIARSRDGALAFVKADAIAGAKPESPADE